MNPLWKLNENVLQRRNMHVYKCVPEVSIIYRLYGQAANYLNNLPTFGNLNGKCLTINASINLSL